MRTTWISLALLALLLLAAPAEAQNVAELSAPGPGELMTIGFETQRDGTVGIEAQGLLGEDSDDNRVWNWTWGSRDDNDDLSCYAWLIDADTRDAVWVMDSDETERGDTRDLRKELLDIDLPAGRYELYLYADGGQLDHDGWSWGERSRRRAREALEEDLESCYVRLSSDQLGSVSTFEPNGQFDDALIAFVGVGDSELKRQGFEISRETKLRAYGLMEYSRGSDDPADFGWILDIESGERVWDMSDRRGRRAGGGSKNRLLDRELTLEPGRYLLIYGTDDSHSAEEFNVHPPHDPLAWGIQLLPGDGYQSGSLRTFDAPGRGSALLDFSGARDDEFFEQPFRLSRDADLHIYAIGEGVDDGWTWVDYGWIIDASTGETVWEMEGRNTFPAGGAEKNRMYDAGLSLPAGDYVAFYITDGSHSWEDWNSGAPFDPQAWGMQIFAAEGTDASVFSKIDREEVQRGAGVIVDLTRMRDRERERERFTIDTPTKVEIYAVGEGVRGHMYDFGTVRNLDTRRVVWEMDYRDTDHAGGANKNRMQRDVITLEPGEYEAEFETDGSHSFGDWNDSRPHDPLSWGMVIRKVD